MEVTLMNLKLESAEVTKMELIKTFNPQKEKVQIKNIRKTKRV